MQYMYSTVGSYYVYEYYHRSTTVMSKPV
eukprot:COSAG02_NODE_7514_length_2977_cov_1.808895_5_plen_28_part_01